METLHLAIDGWERDALEELARERGLDAAALAHEFICDRIRRQRRTVGARPGAERTERQIEQRLVELFEY